MDLPRGNPEQRLARLHRACLNGMQASAELELSTWCRDSDCPPAALRLSATLLAQRGEYLEAEAVLSQQGRRDAQSMEAEDLMLAVALGTRLDLPEDTTRLMHVLHDRFGHLPEVAGWIAATDTVGVAALPTLAFSRVDQLAMELRDRIDLVPSLVFAQKARPRTSALTLLRSALTRLVPVYAQDSDASLTLCKALAELSRLTGDDSEARRWAHRGLKLDPYSAELALILSWVHDDPAVGEPTTDVLRRVAGRHPDYPDVVAALGRRTEHDTDWTDRRAA